MLEVEAVEEVEEEENDEAAHIVLPSSIAVFVGGSDDDGDALDIIQFSVGFLVFRPDFSVGLSRLLGAILYAGFPTFDSK